MEGADTMLAPVFVSIKTAVLAGIFTFFLGLAAAYIVARQQGRYRRAVLDGILTLPLVLPPTVAGFFLLYIFGVRGILGRFFMWFFHMKIAFSWEATVIAAVAISFPLMYRSALGALMQVDENLLFAARTLGMTERAVFFKVWLPATREGLVSGAILAFARGLGEFGATAMLAGNVAGKTRTLPLAVYSEVAAGNMDRAGHYVLVLVAISFLAVALMSMTGEKKYALEKYKRKIKESEFKTSELEE